jgi:hypothetical protein
MGRRWGRRRRRSIPPRAFRPCRRHSFTWDHQDLERSLPVVEILLTLLTGLSDGPNSQGFDGVSSLKRQETTHSLGYLIPTRGWFWRFDWLWFLNLCFCAFGLIRLHYLVGVWDSGLSYSEACVQGCDRGRKASASLCCTMR